MGRLTYRKHITRAMVRAEPSTLFVFGDNLERRGFGGQAKEMRGENNAVGIPTKLRPSRSESAYLTDSDFRLVRPAIDMAFERLFRHAGAIVWPADGIGTGLAELPKRAPRIWGYIESRLLALKTEGERK